MNKLYEKYIKTDSLPTLFCPGCGNGIIQIAAMNAMESLGIKDEVACVSGIGCSSWIPCYFDLDVMHTMHGRALAFAEGLKLAQPDKKIMVFTGDGDCLAIGGNHLMHAAARNIDLTVVMVNNYIYGMTGGQKSPSTPKGSVTKTSPFGSIDEPIDGCKLVTALGASYVARWTTAHPVQLAKSIAEGIQHKGFSFIEVLSQCPVQAGKSVYGEKDPAAIMKTYKENTYLYKEGGEVVEGKIPIGVFKHDKTAVEYIERIETKLRDQGIERG
jgi:2-oxoglutarate ferredoxin oxidoreductase subunit beta